jgi:hypothetical protein
VTVDVARRVVAGVPVLLARDAGEHPGPRPVVLWLHGFRAAAEDNRDELVRIAAAGFLAVGVDAVGHGARRDPALSERIAASPGGALPVMLALADATARELPALVAALVETEGADPARVALVGVSMGGFLVYRAVPALPALAAAVALLGSPEWPGPDSPHARPHAFHHVALLSITAERDVNVPPDAARRFHAALAADHPRPERARHLELRDAEHLMTGAQWHAAMEATLDWLRTHAR